MSASEQAEQARQLAEIDRLRAEVARLRAAAEKLQRFKGWVHQYLDGKGVPAEFPDGPHTREGCRIGDRLDAAFAEFRAAALAEEAQTGDDEAHRRAWDRYMAAKRSLIAAGEER